MRRTRLPPQPPLPPASHPRASPALACRKGRPPSTPPRPLHAAGIKAATTAGQESKVLDRRRVQGFPARSQHCGLRLLGSSSPPQHGAEMAQTHPLPPVTTVTWAGGGEDTPRDEDNTRPRTQQKMALMWLQVGQCGNQIGQEWWQLLSSNVADADRYPYFSRDGLINAVCVDTEPKVIRKLRQQVKKGYFRDANIIVGQRGRGNNWAYGYQGILTSGEKSLLDRTMEAFRKEVERRDCYSGTVILHSLCGGTGSGMGSRLCEEIREEYPAGYILSVTAAPHQTGDSPLQHYNSLLCLAWMQRFCDGVLLFQNDEVMKRAASLVEKKTFTTSGLQPSVSLTSMNAHVASCLAGLLCPVYSLKTRSSVSVGLEPWELIRCLCPMSSMKFLHTSQVCRRGTASWDKVTSALVQTIPRADPNGHLHHSLSALAVARNSQDYSFLLSRDSVLTKLRQAYRCVSWNPSAIHCWTDPENILDPSCYSHSLTVCANHSSAADLMSSVVSKAQTMYDAGAYLHWYRRYGCEDDHFQMSFDILNSVVDEYRGLGVP
ncbi:tubulin delta chain-like isoform X1 [Bufo gargarizans]|uniref:tubulin delta chain-like isoform X1 n=2 Tax=Bufo gargarizans TaxID=30331 RepID=UPI001CF27E83|nr:tubulin delta chain-like isoform X1 [Bufo gargarizans]